MISRTRYSSELLVLTVLCGFLFFFGLGNFGLLGADEPRYAQVAHEMFSRHDWITPTLGGKPWLEKPIFYYWEAMLAYSVFGVSDWAARLPSAVDAALMVFAVYLFLRRFRPSIALDGALITASAAGVIGFARAASTDMPLAAMLTIALLAWYAWQESGKKLNLALFYVSLALGILAKGPIAPFLAVAIIALFAVAKGEFRLLQRTLWLPGCFLFCLVALPWFVAVQVRNPEFFRVFFLEHNLARFGTNLYRHPQPFWYYVPVTLLALAPWTVFAITALVGSVRAWWNERKEPARSEDSFLLFLVIWIIVPLVFFSISHSKLPGYILPALPAGTLLLAEFMRQRAAERPNLAWTVVHALLASLLSVPAIILLLLSAPMIQYVLFQHRIPWSNAVAISLASALVLAIGIVLALRTRFGLSMLRLATLVPVIFVIAVLLRVGAPAVDATLSARPVAREIEQLNSHHLPVAALRVSRETEFGLQFYCNQSIPRYELGLVPTEDHIVVAPEYLRPDIEKHTLGRKVLLLGSWKAQRLEYYLVSSR